MALVEDCVTAGTLGAVGQYGHLCSLPAADVARQRPGLGGTGGGSLRRVAVTAAPMSLVRGGRSPVRPRVVAVSHAEGAPSLPGASAEAAALAELLPNAVVLSGAQATYENVVRALPSHAIAHLSCHGVTYWESPAAGTLVLHDHLTRPLTVEQISAMELPWAELAYLSACSTSFTHLNTVDEAVHITGAFQLAGYRNVVGTLWPVNDATSADIARTTYETLTQGGNTAPRTDLSAHALHQAIRSLRDRYPASPSLWAGHIHVGR